MPQVDTTNLSRLEKAQLACALLAEVGDYDNAINGAVAEVFAEEKLGMSKAPRGQTGYDGTIDGRKVSVKGKKHGAHADSGTYVSIPRGRWSEIDDVLVVFVEERSGRVHRYVGPVQLDKLTGSVRQGDRFHVHHMIAVGAPDVRM